MEAILGIAPSGSYDEAMFDPIRAKAVRLAMLKYALLVRDTQVCGCGRCECDRAMKEEERDG